MILISILVALLLMYIGERAENNTKKEYIEKGYDWNKVIIYSNLAGVLIGLLSVASVLISSIHLSLNMYFIVFATTITAYVTVQSIMTDLKILLINRKILRVAYISIYIISIINIATNDFSKYFFLSLLMFTGLLLFMFIFSPVGASDVRLLAVGIPYAISVGGYSAIFLLIVTLVLLAFFMYIKRLLYVRKQMPEYKEKFPEMLEELGEFKFMLISKKTIMTELNTLEKHAMPVGPFMIMPFLVSLIIYPFFI